MSSFDKLRMTRSDKLILRQAQDDRWSVTLSLSKSDKEGINFIGQLFD